MESIDYRNLRYQPRASKGTTCKAKTECVGIKRQASINLWAYLKFVVVVVVVVGVMGEPCDILGHVETNCDGKPVA